MNEATETAKPHCPSRSDGGACSALDGTDLLCIALYGRKGTAKEYLGGSEAKMLYDAAAEIGKLRCLLREARSYVMLYSPSGEPFDWPKDVVERIDAVLPPNE